MFPQVLSHCQDWVDAKRAVFGKIEDSMNTMDIMESTQLRNSKTSKKITTPDMNSSDTSELRSS